MTAPGRSEAVTAQAGRRFSALAPLGRWVLALLYELIHRPVTWVLGVLGLVACGGEAYGLLAMLGAGQEHPLMDVGLLHAFVAVGGPTAGFSDVLGCLAVVVAAGQYRVGAAAQRSAVIQNRRRHVLASVIALLVVTLAWAAAAGVVCWATSLMPAVRAVNGHIVSPLIACVRSAAPLALLPVMAAATGMLTRRSGTGVALWYFIVLLLHTVSVVVIGLHSRSPAVAVFDPLLAVQRLGLLGTAVSADLFPFPQWQYGLIAAVWLGGLGYAGVGRALRDDL